MTDETSAAMFATGTDWLASHRREYIESGGTRGHILDLTFSGGRTFSPHLLINVIGRKSGKSYVHPLFYSSVGGEVVIVASKGGADTNPSWYTNLVARPDLRFQIATQAFRATWREPAGAERDWVWDFIVRNNNAFAGYQASTTRRIPLVMLMRGEEVPVFTAADHEG